MTENNDAVAAAHFNQDMLAGCHELKRLGYWPGSFHKEVARIGGVQTVKNLLSKPDTSEGFSTLWTLGRLDLSAGAFVLLPWYRRLFKDDERKVAAQRLAGVRFDVHRFLADAVTPTWSAQP